MANHLNYRNANPSDLKIIVEIYNSTIASGTVTADTEPVSVDSKCKWFKEHNPTNRPLWMIQNEKKQILGWVSFQSFYGRPAYNATAEISIYLDEKQRGKGIGKQVLQHCLKEAPGLGIKTLLGFIFANNQRSLGLFLNFGFEVWGLLPNIALVHGEERGFKIPGKRIA